jgi:LysR family transcriptional regulator, glycine cleavage system transcriptional activator
MPCGINRATEFLLYDFMFSKLKTAMPNTPLPPLNALRAFEATARQMSFKLAAAELHVSPPAISHQIKALERFLGFALFYRLRRGIKLTEKGSAYFYRVARALEVVATATSDARQPYVQPRLSLAVPPNLLSTWLLTRLPHFLEKHPFVDVRIFDTLRQVDFDGEGVDAQIYFGTNAWQGVELERLADEDLCPVCSPAFLNKVGRLASLRDLSKVPLIHTERRSTSWEKILRSAGHELRAPRNLVFLHSQPVIEAAVHGMGVAIANRICVADLLEARSLVIPFELQPKPTPKFSYFLVRPMRSLKDTRIEVLRDWLVSEMHRSLKKVTSAR